MRSVRTCCLALLLGAITACGSRGTCDACAHPPIEPSKQYACNETAVSNAFGTASLLAASGPIDMLFLSGGGSHGAYGAGVLYSWPKTAQPGQFAVVTGVSAGALQATWAFLGGATANQAMYWNYTHLSDNEVYKTRPLLALLWAPSAATSDGLENLINDAFPDATIAQVGADYGKRLLCVGTVNLDTGRFVAWDMTAIAAAHKPDLYRKVLRASASIPVVFPPVKIDKTLYADGGTRQEVFAAPILADIEARRKQAYPTNSQKDHAHFLINLDLNVHPKCVQPHIKDIAKRTLQLVLTEGVYGSVFRARSDLGDLSDRVELDYRFIPSTYTVGFKSDKFDPALMCSLFCKGFTDGKQPWEPAIPDMPVADQECSDNDFAGDTLHCSGQTPTCP